MKSQERKPQVSFDEAFKFYLADRLRKFLTVRFGYLVVQEDDDFDLVILDLPVTMLYTIVGPVLDEFCDLFLPGGWFIKVDDVCDGHVLTFNFKRKEEIYGK